MIGRAPGGDALDKRVMGYDEGREQSAVSICKMTLM